MFDLGASGRNPEALPWLKGDASVFGLSLKMNAFVFRPKSEVSNKACQVTPLYLYGLFPSDARLADCVELDEVRAA